MREVILAAVKPGCANREQEWMARIVAFAESLLLLAPTLVPASDPFFERGEPVAESSCNSYKQLKYELARAAVYSGNDAGDFILQSS